MHTLTHTHRLIYTCKHTLTHTFTDTCGAQTHTPLLSPLTLSFSLSLSLLLQSYFIKLSDALPCSEIAEDCTFSNALFWADSFGRFHARLHQYSLKALRLQFSLHGLLSVDYANKQHFHQLTKSLFPIYYYVINYLLLSVFLN